MKTEMRNVVDVEELIGFCLHCEMTDTEISIILRLV